MRSKVSFFFLLCVAFLVASVSAFGQVGAGGTILGTVTDSSGASVPNAAITITNLDTSAVSHANSNASGEYVAPGLPIGHYSVSVEVQGFKKSEQNNVALNVGDRTRIDLKLEIGSTQESIVVEADAIAVQSESSEISDVINGTQVSQLSTNGRSIYSLAALTPGASSNQMSFQSATPVGGDATVSFNGLRQSHNLYMIDGGEDLDRGGSGNISVMPSIDAIAEFRMMTSNYSAEYGLSSGATFTMVFKNGTKDFHASAWEFFRNNDLDANNYFLNRGGLQPPELRFNTYGFNVGGPVFVPKLYNKDRERTFFFYNMEWRKLIQGGTINQTVPLTSQYGGNFGSTITGIKNLHTPCINQVSPAIAAQYTGMGLALSNCSAPGTSGLVSFPGNVIPTSLLNPNAQLLLKQGIFPANNSGNYFDGGNNSPTNVREEIIRVDHHFTDKFWIFGHWVSEQISQTYGTSQWNSDNLPTSADVFGNPSYSGVVHATYTITPTLLNETAFNYNGNRISIVPTGEISRPAGLSIPELFPGNNLDRNPSIILGGGESAAYDIGSWPWHNKADDYQVRDDLSWTKGNHQIKFGASWMLYKKVQDLFGNTQGNFNFNGNYTGNGFADFLLGYANSYNELAVQDAGHWDNQSYDAYVQDNWKVSPRLTLNLGLRWDGIPHTYEENNRQSNFYPSLYNPANAAIILPNGNISPNSPGLGTSPNPLLAGYQFYLNGIGVAGQNGVPDGLVKNQWANIAPRVGLAYDLTGAGKTIFRAGFGIMYERIQGNDVYNAGPNIPFSSSVTLNNVSLSSPNTSLLTGQTVTAPITAAAITGLSLNDYKNPASYQYSAGIQQQLGRDSVFSVSYVGNENRHQNDYREINLPNPSVLPALEAGTVSYNTVLPYQGFNSIRISEDGENSNYNSLQAELRAQVRRDLTLQVAYTYSKAMDPATSGGGLGDLANVSDPYNRGYDYGPSGLDRTHIGLVNFVYSLPIFRNSDHRFLKSTLGGWELSGIITMESGLPYTVTEGGSLGSNGIDNATNRPNLVGNISYPHTVAEWFDTSIFQDPAPGQWGSAGKGIIRGPGRDNWDLSLLKEFVFSEARGSHLEFRAESFNTLNHTEFQNFDTTKTDGNFGQLTSTFDPRVFQLALKLYF